MPRLPNEDRPPALESSQQEIGGRIAGLRRALGITQKQLAEIVGVTRTVITDYERGRVRIYDEMIARLARALGTSSDELLGIEKTEEAAVQSLRIAKRLRELEDLPEAKRKKILSTLDDLIRANK